MRTVGTDQDIQRLLEEIRDEQRREAQRSRIRWTRLTIVVAVTFLVALPAICSYIHHLLVIWF
jgi:hypothetical protein